MEDGKIIALYFARDQRAVEETAGKYGNYCLSIAKNILPTREDAEECVNDTYLSAWNSIPPHRPKSLRLFLGKITRRISIDRWRRQSAQKRGGGELALALEELYDCVSDGMDVAKDYEARELSRVINAFVQSLPGPEQRVFLCRYWYLDPIADIAKRFHYSQPKVKSMLFRTREKLRKQLTEEGFL